MAKRHRRKRNASRRRDEYQLPLPEQEGTGEVHAPPFELTSEAPPPDPVTSGLPADGDPSPDASAVAAEVSETGSPVPAANRPRFDIDSSPPRRDPSPEPSIGDLLQRGEYDQALPIIESALEESPADLDLLLAAGRAYSMAGDYDRAMRHLDAALESRPDDLRIQREKGVALFSRGLYGEAAEALSIVCARSESDGEAYYYRGEALNRAGRAEEAMRAMEKAVRLAPEDLRSLRSLGRIYDRLGMSDKAAEMHARVRKAPTP